MTPPPVAAAAADCTDLTCALDASASTDANGDTLTYSGTSATAPGGDRRHDDPRVCRRRHLLRHRHRDRCHGLTATRSISVVVNEPVPGGHPRRSSATSARLPPRPSRSPVTCGPATSSTQRHFRQWQRDPVGAVRLERRASRTSNGLTALRLVAHRDRRGRDDHPGDPAQHRLDDADPVGLSRGQFHPADRPDLRAMAGGGRHQPAIDQPPAAVSLVRSSARPATAPPTERPRPGPRRVPRRRQGPRAMTRSAASWSTARRSPARSVATPPGQRPAQLVGRLGIELRR